MLYLLFYILNIQRKEKFEDTTEVIKDTTEVIKDTTEVIKYTTEVIKAVNLGRSDNAIVKKKTKIQIMFHEKPP